MPRSHHTPGFFGRRRLLPRRDTSLDRPRLPLHRTAGYPSWPQELLSLRPGFRNNLSFLGSHLRLLSRRTHSPIYLAAFSIRRTAGLLWLSGKLALCRKHRLTTTRARSQRTAWEQYGYRHQLYSNREHPCHDSCFCNTLLVHISPLAIIISHRLRQTGRTGLFSNTLNRISSTVR
ncbi:hypothetical protein B0J12DRAFT_159912 [Macrophomina phaseolina]|uniref:Uncharacterized protein n=1 Tax=Macrophomina phaseolina TaxID=35725 RepID=A0ABQ8GRN5_9PEZI|nr:hypothetical protein B0J12DRAFT_159912 [Macrophomina phaseolina]